MNNGIKFLLLAFVTLMIGLVLLVVYSDMTIAKTQTTGVVNEEYNIATARSKTDAISINTTSPNSNYTISYQSDEWKQTDCPITKLVYGNSTDTYVLDTDYTFNAAKGRIHLLDTVTTNKSLSNLTYLDYNYCPDDYINSSWGRSVANISVGLAAILVFGSAIVFVILAMKEFKV